MKTESMAPTTTTLRKDQVKEYYGQTLKGSEDLKTDACCTADVLPKYIKDIIKDLHDEVVAKYYGCGLCVPFEVKGCDVLDLGSGSGRDCYLLSKLVGESGSVVGIDMTKEQLDVAQRHIEYHQKQFGYAKPNVSFVEGNIENLTEVGLKDQSFDIIVSNCVVNLAENKRAVLEEAYRVLREGGEFYFSDVYCDRRVPEELKNDPVLWGECLSGALYWNDFHTLCQQAGFQDPRVVASRPLEIDNKEIEHKLEGYNFYSVTYRLFKLPKLERACEDFGQAVRYKGTMNESPSHFDLDDHHRFITGKIEPVCGNTYMMLNDTRFCEHFEFYGDFSTHYGIFQGCGTDIPYSSSASGESSSGAACC